MKAKQTSESIELGILLAISGGMMDAYSYIMRGEVFANAQTGNMLLFGVYISEGNLHRHCTIFARFWHLQLVSCYPILCV